MIEVLARNPVDGVEELIVNVVSLSLRQPIVTFPPINACLKCCAYLRCFCSGLAISDLIAAASILLIEESTQADRIRRGGRK